MGKNAMYGILIAAAAVIISLLTYMAATKDRVALTAGTTAVTIEQVNSAKAQLDKVSMEQRTIVTTVAEHGVEIEVLKSSVARLVGSQEETNHALWTLIGAIENEVRVHDGDSPP